MKKVQVAINVPSGKLICGNDFRELYNVKGDFNVNETVGIKQTVEAYGKVGMFYAYCGNSCPSIYKSGNKIYVASEAYDEKNDRTIDPNLGKRVGNICTDLWWYCIADYDDFIARGGHYDKRWYDVVDVEPGRYILSYDLFSRKEWNELEIFGTIYKSNRSIKPWKMVEEGAAEAITKCLPKKYKQTKTTSVKCPKGCDKEWWKERGHNKHTMKTNLFIKTAFKEKDDTWKKIGYEVWGQVYDGKETAFVKIIVNGKQLQNYKDMARKVVANFKKELKEYKDLERKFNSIKSGGEKKSAEILEMLKNL